MNLSKRLLLLSHLNKFILDQYQAGETTSDILAMINYKSDKYNKISLEETKSPIRKTYLVNYSLILKKRVIDYHYFRRKYHLNDYDDFELFKLIDFRDKIIFQKIFTN